MSQEVVAARFYTDVRAGYEPNEVQWQHCNHGLPPEVPHEHKRIWIEIEMPSDMELFPERLSGYELAPVGQRQIQMESPPERQVTRKKPMKKVARRIREEEICEASDESY